jgi:hypothetical protein
MLSIALQGTLIAASPTRDGLVIAADSRSTLGRQHCDDTYKLVEVAHAHPTALAVAGIGIVFTKPPADVADICAWVKNAARVMDIEACVKAFLESKPDEPLSESLLMLVGDVSLEEVKKLTDFSPDAPEAYAGNNLYTIVVGSYDAKARLSRLGALGVRFNPTTRLAERTDRAFWEFSPDTRGQVFHFGLHDYVPHVFREGRRFLDEYAAFKPHKRYVREISRNRAVAALSNLLEAAARTTAIVRPPDGSGIGGPTDVLLLGAEAKPSRIRWKGK